MIVAQPFQERDAFGDLLALSRRRRALQSGHGVVQALAHLAPVAHGNAHLLKGATCAVFECSAPFLGQRIEHQHDHAFGRLDARAFGLDDRMKNRPYPCALRVGFTHEGIEQKRFVVIDRDQYGFVARVSTIEVLRFECCNQCFAGFARFDAREDHSHKRHKRLWCQSGHVVGRRIRREGCEERAQLWLVLRQQPVRIGNAGLGLRVVVVL